MILRKIIFYLNVLLGLVPAVLTGYYMYNFIMCEEEECTHYLNDAKLSLGLFIAVVLLYLIRKRFYPVPGVDYE